MEVNNAVKGNVSASSRDVRMAFGQFQSAFGSGSTFSTYKHQTCGTGDSGNNGSLPQPFIPTSNFNLPEEPTSSYMPWSTDDNPYELIKYAQNNIKSRNLTENECDGDTDLHGLVSNILENANSVESYYTEGNTSTLKSVWSPKTMREDFQQYFEPESKVQPSCAFLPNHILTESFNKAQGQPMVTDAEELCQQLNSFGTSDQWLFSSCNGDMDTFIPQSQKLPKPPGLPMPSMANLNLSKSRQSKHEYISANQIGGLSKPVNNFSDLDDAFTPQSKMSTKSADPYYENYSSQSSDRSRRTKQYSPQEVNKLISNFQALMAGEKDSSCGGELQTNKQTMQMHYEDSTAEQRRFISPRMPGHSTPVMDVQKELGEDFGAAVQRESNERVRKLPFQGDFGSKDLSGIGPQHTEYFQEPKPLSSSFNPPKSYQNKMATQKGNTSLITSLNQYSQHHSQLHNKIKQPRVNCVPSASSKMLSQSVSEFIPQLSQQMQRGPLCIQDYFQGDMPNFHCRPGQSQVFNGLDSLRRGDGDLEIKLEKNRMHMAGLLGEGFSTLHLDGNTRPQTSTHMSERDKKHGLPQKPYFDLAGNIYGSQRFGGGNSTVSAGKTPQFLSVMYPLSDPRQSSCHMPTSSSNFNPRSSLSYGSGIPLMDLGDILPETEFTAFNHYLSDLMGCRGESLHPGMASVLRSPRMMMNRGGPMSQLHFYLEECYEQWRCMERERKKTEAYLTKAYPGKQILGMMSSALPKVPPNPSKVDRLIVDQMREQARVVSLLGKMERLRSFPLHANINSALDRHYEAICLTQARRKDEFINTSNRQKQGGAHFREERDILLLAIALRDLCATTRKSRTALWCALQMTMPKSIERLDDHVDSEGTCE